MMFDTLYLFLVRYKQITLPEIGVIGLQTEPAKAKFIDRELSPPAYSFVLSTTGRPVSNKLFGWLSQALNVSEAEAIARFNDFIFDLKNQLQDGKEIRWKGVGKFSKGLMNDIEFETERKELAFQQPILAEKAVRENAKHVVVVGERERTGSTISEIMAESEVITVEKNNWWIWPVAVIAVLLIFIAWYISEHGISPSSSSNGQRSTPKEAPAGFYFSK